MKRKLLLTDAGPAFLIAYIAMFAIQFAISIFAVTGNMADGDELTDLSDAATWALIIGNQIAFFGATLAFVRRRRIDFIGEIGLKKKLNGKQTALLPLISLAAICAFLPLANWFVSLFELAGFTYDGATFENGNLLFMIFAVAVLPAFGEEFLFRGIVTTAGKERSFSFAIIMSAAMFSIMHGSPVQTVHQFGLGLIFAYVLCLTGDIKYSMILHFLNNFLSIILDELLVLAGLSTVSIPWYVAIPVDVVMCVVGTFALMMLLKEFTRISRDKASGIEVAGEAYPDGKFKTLLRESAATLGSLFKKGGLKSGLSKMNDDLEAINPRDYTDVYGIPEDYFEGFDVTPVQRKAEVPSSLKLAFLIIILVWLVQTAMGFVGML